MEELPSSNKLIPTPALATQEIHSFLRLKLIPELVKRAKASSMSNNFIIVHTPDDPHHAHRSPNHTFVRSSLKPPCYPLPTAISLPTSKSNPSAKPSIVHLKNTWKTDASSFLETPGIPNKLGQQQFPF